MGAQPLAKGSVRHISKGLERYIGLQTETVASPREKRVHLRKELRTGTILRGAIFREQRRPWTK